MAHYEAAGEPYVSLGLLFSRSHPPPSGHLSPLRRTKIQSSFVLKALAWHLKAVSRLDYRMHTLLDFNSLSVHVLIILYRCFSNICRIYSVFVKVQQRQTFKRWTCSFHSYSMFTADHRLQEVSPLYGEMLLSCGQSVSAIEPVQHPRYLRDQHESCNIK